MKPFCAFIICLLAAVICWLCMMLLGREKPQTILPTQDEINLDQIRINHSVDARLRKLEAK